jgi:hypothetical protein
MFQGGNEQVIFSNPASTEALVSSTHKLEKCAKMMSKQLTPKF